MREQDETFCVTLLMLWPQRESNVNIGVCIKSARLFRYQLGGMGNAKGSHWGSLPM